MSDDTPFKTSPSGLRKLRQALEVRNKVRSLTNAIEQGRPIETDEPEKEASEHSTPPPKPTPKER
jgi:hypothetical protein